MAAALTLLLLTIPIDIPGTNPLWLTIGIDPHNFRLVVGPIAY